MGRNTGLNDLIESERQSVRFHEHVKQTNQTMEQWIREDLSVSIAKGIERIGLLRTYRDECLRLKLKCLARAFDVIWLSKFEHERLWNSINNYDALRRLANQKLKEIGYDDGGIKPNASTRTETIRVG